MYVYQHDCESLDVNVFINSYSHFLLLGLAIPLNLQQRKTTIFCRCEKCTKFPKRRVEGGGVIWAMLFFAREDFLGARHIQKTCSVRYILAARTSLIYKVRERERCFAILP